MKECNLIWKPVDLSFKALSVWDQVTKQNSGQLRILNHIENMRNITTKTGIVRSLKRYYHTIATSFEDTNPGEEVIQLFDIIPTTFIVHSQFKTSDLHKFLKRFSDLSTNEGNSMQERLPVKHCKKNMWLVKPAAMNQGRGIEIFSKIREIFEFLELQATTNSYWIIQKYIERPLLFKGRKFDIRMWVLVTSGANGNEMNVYFYQQGYLRTSSSDYDLQDENRYIHLTNNCLQQKGDAYGQHEIGNTLGFEAFQQYLNQHYPQYKINIGRDFIPKMKDIIIDTLSSIKQDLNPSRRKNSFELLGYDFLIDEDFRVWLLEVNNNPYLGVPNEFIRGLLPNMIRNMFKIVLPQGDYVKKDGRSNLFELILSDTVNQRRGFGIDELYPISQVKQSVGKDKRAQMILKRKERFGQLQQANQSQNQGERNRSTYISPANKTMTMSFCRTSLNIPNLVKSVNTKEIQVMTQETQSNLLMKAIYRRNSPEAIQSQKKMLKQEYRELHKISVKNQYVMYQIKGNDEPLVNNMTPINERRNYFKKDILEQTKELCMRKDSQISSSQFDHLFNKILSKIQQWELFDDKQISKTLEAYDILTKSKAILYFQEPFIIDRIVKIIENDTLSQQTRVFIFRTLEQQSKLLSQNTSFIENKNLFTLLEQVFHHYEQDFLEPALRLMSYNFQLENVVPKGYIPKLTKERQLLRQKAIENGYLTMITKIMLSGRYEQEIRQQILNRLQLKDLQYQLSLFPQGSQLPEHVYLVKFYDKLKTDKESQVLKQQQLKQQQIEVEQRQKQKYDEEKEISRKQAETLFFKRLEEKKHKRQEELKKQMLEQQNLQKQLDEKKKAQLDQIKKRQQHQKTLKKQHQRQSLVESEVFPGYHTNVMQSPKGKPDLILKKKNSSLNKEIVDLSNLMDNLIVFTQQKLIDTQRNYDDSPTKFPNQKSITAYDFNPSQAIPQQRKVVPRCNQQNMLRNFRHVKERPDVPDLVSLFSNDYNTTNAFQRVDKYNKTTVQGSGSFMKLYNLSEKKFKKNQMVLPSLDYEVSTDLTNNLLQQLRESNSSHKSKALAYFKQRANSRIVNQEKADTALVLSSGGSIKQRKLSPIPLPSDKNLLSFSDTQPDEAPQPVSEVFLQMLNTRKSKASINL